MQTLYHTSFRLKYKKTPIQIIAESRLPSGAAQPIGKRVSGQNFEARYAPGILIKMIESELCINEMKDLPIAVK